MDSIAKPVPVDGQAIVKIKAFGLNRMDLLQREGQYPLPPQAPETMGVEFSGIIEEFGGKAHEDFKIGDEVFGLAYGGMYMYPDDILNGLSGFTGGGLLESGKGMMGVEADF